MAAPGPPLPLPPRLSPERSRQVLGGTRTVLFDCDGVLWEGERALPGAREVVGALQARGGPSAAIFVSNNSRRSRAELGQRFRGLGFRGVRDTEVYTSGHCAARYLRACLLGAREGIGGALQGIRGAPGLPDLVHGAQDQEQGRLQGPCLIHEDLGSRQAGLCEQGLQEEQQDSEKGDQGTEKLKESDNTSNLWDHETNQGLQELRVQQSTEGTPQDQEVGLQPPQSACTMQGFGDHGPGSQSCISNECGVQCDLHAGQDTHPSVKEDQLQGEASAGPHEHDIHEDAPLVFVIGGAGLRRELLDAGLRVMGENDTSASVRAVLVGYDEEFTFRKLSRACTFLRDPNCLLVATDRDPWHLLSGGRCTPGTGSLVAAVETAAGRPAVVVGKPSMFMFEDILSKHDLDPACTLMVGDRLEVDIQFGRNCGLTSILTLTGVSQLADVQAYAESNSSAQRHLVPNFYMESIADLLPGLEGYEEEL